MRFGLETPFGKIEIASDEIVPRHGKLFLACAGCDELKSIEAFGFRSTVSGAITNQVFCAACRAKASPN